MIFITYQTKELKAHHCINDKPYFVYEKINQFFERYGIAINKNIVKDSLEDILEEINCNSLNEKIYYEKVDEHFNYIIKPIEIFSKWERLFKELNNYYENKIKAKEDVNNLSPIKLKIIVINNDNKLGPWQSIEILNTLPYEVDVYWINVKKFLNVIDEVKTTMNSHMLSEFTPNASNIFKRNLLDKAKKIR